MRRLRSCDFTICVGKIDRLTSHEPFKNQYKDAFRRRRSGSVILVATRSDDLNSANTEKGTEDDGQLASIEERMNTVEIRIKTIEIEIEKNKLAGNKKLNKKLRAKKNKMK
jgi:hypothetical protein